MSKSKTKNNSNSSNSNSTTTTTSSAVAVLPLPSVLETRVPVVLIVGGPKVGKTSVAAAVLHDAVKHDHLRVLALVPSVSSFRTALEKCGGCEASGPLSLGIHVVQVVEEVSGGCVCCTVRRDIEDVLADEALAGSPSFDLVVIDTAATSDPMPVIATLFEEHANEVVTPEVSQSFHLDAVVCVIDGNQLDDLGSTVHEARQLAFADVIVVTNPQTNNNQNGTSSKTSKKKNGTSSKNGGNSKLFNHHEFSDKKLKISSNIKNQNENNLITGGEGVNILAKMSKSVTLSTNYLPSENNRFCLSAQTSATEPNSFLSEKARQIICEINPLVQIKELPPECLGLVKKKKKKSTSNHKKKEDMIQQPCPKCRELEAAEKRKLQQLKNSGLIVASSDLKTSMHDHSADDNGTNGEVMRRLVGFNTYCAAAFDRLDLSGLLTIPPEPRLIGASGVTTTVVFAEGRLMQRRFRDCMSALLRLCKEIVTGHDLPISELYACLRMSLIEEAEKSADAMAQALLAEIAAEAKNDMGDDGDDGDVDKGSHDISSNNRVQSKKAKKKAKEKQLRELKENKRLAEEKEKADQAAKREVKLKMEREEKLRAKVLEERKRREEKEALWEVVEAERRRTEKLLAQGLVEEVVRNSKTEFLDQEDFELQAALKASLEMDQRPSSATMKTSKPLSNNKDMDTVVIAGKKKKKKKTKQTPTKDMSSQQPSSSSSKKNDVNDEFYFCSNCGTRTREVTQGPVAGSVLCRNCDVSSSSTTNSVTTANTFSRPKSWGNVEKKTEISVGRRGASNQHNLATQKWCIGCDDADCQDCIEVSMVSESMEKMTRIDKEIPADKTEQVLSSTTSFSQLKHVNPTNSFQTRALSPSFVQSHEESITMTPPGLLPPPGLMAMPNSQFSPSLNDLNGSSSMGSGSTEMMNSPTSLESCDVREGDLDLDFLNIGPDADLGELEPGSEDYSFDYNPNATTSGGGVSTGGRSQNDKGNSIQGDESRLFGLMGLFGAKNESIDDPQGRKKHEQMHQNSAAFGVW